MDFRLVYEGRLPGQHAKARDKQAIRRAIRPQLERLWLQTPLSEMRDYLKFPTKPPNISIIEERGQTKFAPLITSKLNLYAELDVLMFRPEPCGHLLTSSGDIDNRLKTLIDALRMPRKASEQGEIEPDTSGVFHCLLQDDSLVSKISLEVDQLLEPRSADSVLAIIHVSTKRSRTSLENLMF